MPSPQVVTQLLGSPVHVQPGSVKQRSLQPSPAVVFVSSQVSAPLRMPSPQIPAHTLGSPWHANPGSTAQSASQPSPGNVFWSSQSSAPVIAPSLQNSTTQTVPSHALLTQSAGVVQGSPSW